jgi:hypothetical protein
MQRAGGLALAGGIAVAAAVVVTVALLSRGDDEPSGTTGTGTTATTPAGPGTAPVPPVTEPVPPPADFPGAPPAAAPVEVERAPGGAPLETRYFDDQGDLTVVIAALRAAPAASGPGAVVRCGSAARADAGYRWTRFPVNWRLSRVASPPGVRRVAALAAIRKARGVWNATRSHCRNLRDASRARFRFAGSTPRRVARDGVSTVDVGSVAALGGACPGAVACTITFIVGGNRAVESDTRISSTDVAGFSTARRPARRKLDVQSVMVHESGHTLGFAHVSARDVVMNPFVRRGGVSGRLLGRGDAIASNAKY